jgi:hypothetical protein
MARKKITALLGGDPEYSKTFADTPPISAPAPAEKTAEKPVAKPTEVKPAAVKPAPAPKPKAQTLAPSKPPVSVPKPKSKPLEKTGSASTRAVHVRAVPKTEHKEGLEKLHKAGLPATDVVRLAGKRAIEKFELQQEYVAPEQADRLPTDMSFRTMKTLDAETLDALRDQADPLRLRSDAAVIQGQLEPIFWKELDALIKELSKQYV